MAHRKRAPHSVSLTELAFHALLALLVPLGWSRLIESRFAPHVTLEFWSRFALVCLATSWVAGVRTLSQLSYERELSARAWRKAQPTGFGTSRERLRPVWSAWFLVAPETLAICLTLTATCARQDGAEILGHPPVPCALLALVATLLALGLPALSAWLALMAERHTESRTAARRLWLTWTTSTFALWLLCAPPLRLTGALPLWPLLLAGAFAVGMAALAPFAPPGRWQGPLLGTASGFLALPLALVAAFHLCSLVPLEGLFILLVLAGVGGGGFLTVFSVLRLWPDPGRRSLWEVPPFLLLGILVGALTPLAWFWTLSAVEAADWDPLDAMIWVPSYPTMIGAFGGGLIATGMLCATYPRAGWTSVALVMGVGCSLILFFS